MRQAFRAVALAALLAACSSRAADQEKVNRAVETGVHALRAVQKADGSFDYGSPNTTGSTALAGLTLLECGAEKNDPAVTKAAEYVRVQSIALKHTYSISLAILFLDRLGESGDVALIESLAARLVGGQTAAGGWSYYCPDPVPAEQMRLQKLVTQMISREDDREEAPARKPGHETRDFRLRLATLNVANRGGYLSRPDNSNTQFAALALWVARRHGFPVDNSLRAVELHFRNTQVRDGGWSYGDPPALDAPSSPQMTCAGLLARAIGIGVRADRPDDKGKGGVTDPAKDTQIRFALIKLSESIGSPLDTRPTPVPGAGPAFRFVPGGTGVGGRSFYFLWSLERMAVTLNLDKINGKDWYGWGCDVLLASQQRDGSWSGDYSQGGVDTCFALLFLKRANLASDLSRTLKNRFGNGNARVLRAGDSSGRVDDPKELESKKSPDQGAGKVDVPQREAERPAEGPAAIREPAAPSGPSFEPTPAGRLARALYDMPPEEQSAEIERLRSAKGGDNTVALALAIPYLGASQRKAREALREREARMKDTTVGRDLSDQNPEIRAAAAVVCGMKDFKRFTPELIRLLGDPDPLVARSAYASLTSLTGQDFGPARDASDADRRRAVEQWQEWWKKRSP
jgi:hypothetical protein